MGPLILFDENIGFGVGGGDFSSSDAGLVQALWWAYALCILYLPFYVALVIHV